MTEPTAAPLPDTLVIELREQANEAHGVWDYAEELMTRAADRIEAAAALAQRDGIPREPPFDDALSLAIMFHHTYERLAPSKGYDTRTETRIFDPESPNGKLMVATCQVILDAAPTGIPREPTDEQILRIANEFCTDGFDSRILNALVAAWHEGRDAAMRDAPRKEGERG